MYAIKAFKFSWITLVNVSSMTFNSWANFSLNHGAALERPLVIGVLQVAVFRACDIANADWSLKIILQRSTFAIERVLIYFRVIASVDHKFRLRVLMRYHFVALFKSILDANFLTGVLHTLSQRFRRSLLVKHCWRHHVSPCKLDSWVGSRFVVLLWIQILFEKLKLCTWNLSMLPLFLGKIIYHDELTLDNFVVLIKVVDRAVDAPSLSWLLNLMLYLSQIFEFLKGAAWRTIHALCGGVLQPIEDNHLPICLWRSVITWALCCFLKTYHLQVKIPGRLISRSDKYFLHLFTRLGFMPTLAAHTFAVS